LARSSQGKKTAQTILKQFDEKRPLFRSLSGRRYSGARDYSTVPPLSEDIIPYKKGQISKGAF